MTLEEQLEFLERKFREQERRIQELEARMKELESRVQALSAEVRRQRERLALMERILVEKGLLSPDLSAYAHWLDIIQ